MILWMIVMWTFYTAFGLYTLTRTKHLVAKAWWWIYSYMSFAIGLDYVIEAVS